MSRELLALFLGVGGPERLKQNENETCRGAPAIASIISIPSKIWQFNAFEGV